MTDSTPQRLHPAWIVLRAISTLRTMALPLVIFFFTGRSSGELFGFGIAGLVIVTTIVIRAVGWWRFTYAITSQGIRVLSGLVSRQDRLMPFERIQAVDLREGVLERLLGVSQVRIESAAGTQGSEIVLGAVSRAQATVLRSNLLQQRAVVTNSEIATDVELAPAPSPLASPGPIATGELIYSTSIGSLLIAGATSSRIGPALALFAGIAQFADEILRDTWWERVTNAASDLTLSIIVGLTVVALIFAWIFSTISTVLTFGNFELRRDGDRLLISHGLLERRRSTIPLARIQAVTISEGWLRQPFGLAVLRVESAAYGKTSAESGVLSPIIRRSEIPALLHRACPDYAIDSALPTLERLPSRARRRYIMSNLWWILAGAVVLTVGASLLPWFAWWWGLLILIAVPFAALYGELEFRDAGWIVNAADQVVLRTREVDRVTAITRRTRLQHRSLSQNPLQRRANLASFYTAVASGGVGGHFAILHLDAQRGAELLRRLGPIRARTPNTETVSTLTTPVHDHDDS